MWKAVRGSPYDLQEVRYLVAFPGASTDIREHTLLITTSSWQPAYATRPAFRQYTADWFWKEEPFIQMEKGMPFLYC